MSSTGASSRVVCTEPQASPASGELARLEHKISQEKVTSPTNCGFALDSAAEDHIIVALDCSEDEALRVASELQGKARWLKVGMTLYYLAGPRIIQKFHEMGFKVFLDLKMHDIPHQVKGAVVSAASSGADIISLHALGGSKMIAAARKGLDIYIESRKTQGGSAAGSAVSSDAAVSAQNAAAPRQNAAAQNVAVAAQNAATCPSALAQNAATCSNAPAQNIATCPSTPALVAITILTSHSNKEMAELGIEKSLAHEVKALASLAYTAGAHGLVCSVKEARSLRKELGAACLIITPGVRPTGFEAGDQARVASPQEAFQAGSDMIVIGRPILESRSVACAFARVKDEVEAALNQKSSLEKR